MGTDEEEKRVRMKEATNVVGGVTAERSSLSAKNAIPLSVHVNPRLLFFCPNNPLPKTYLNVGHHSAIIWRYISSFLFQVGCNYSNFIHIYFRLHSFSSLFLILKSAGMSTQQSRLIDKTMLPKCCIPVLIELEEPAQPNWFREFLMPLRTWPHRPLIWTFGNSPPPR